MGVATHPHRARNAPIRRHDVARPGPGAQWLADDVSVADVRAARAWLLAAYMLLAISLVCVIWTRGELESWIVDA